MCSTLAIYKSSIQGCIFCTRLIFSPAAKFVILISLLFFSSKKGEKIKIFSELFILFILSPPPTDYFSFISPRRAEKYKNNVFISFNFHIPPPPPNKIFLYFPPLAGSILQNIHPCSNL